tara:strand:+ start:2236 stop:3714 length:1479 start_codon:yes stop_codon:yes gene_type:complete
VDSTKDMANDRLLLMERGRSGRRGIRLPKLDVPEQESLPDHLVRDELVLPELAEPEVVRYFTRLSQMNFGIDTSFYPLGSCTMKYNPKVNDEIASIPGFASIHPLQPDFMVQGALQLMHELQESLCEITGMPAASLASVAGAHGELVGMLLMRAYHDHNGQLDQRQTVLIPDSAHGTNPASAAMAGYKVVSVPSDVQGNMDMDALRSLVNEEVVGLMITLPNTLGLFDPNIEEICSLVHGVGGLVYGDGANMNALLGQVQLGSLGFDIVHLNLHKTMSTPHGGGGPGAGPITVTSTLAKFLPAPVVTCAKEGTHGDSTYQLGNPELSIGSVGAFHGNFGVLVRAMAYIRSNGADGLREVSENAVLNANYVMRQLENTFDIPYSRTCMHEVVISSRELKPQGVRAMDIAKRLIDYGIHPPTMYFPLIVEEALMIEPTETETKETLDFFIQAMLAIFREIHEDPNVLLDAPHNTANTRLDEALAARSPDLRWKP